MIPEVASKPALVEWAVASRPLAGQQVCGDAHFVKPFGHRVLLAAIDGVGHGDEAVAAARVAVDLLDRFTRDPLEALVRRCHAALTRTRGVVMTVGLVDALQNSVTWLGVGNVEGRLLPANRGARPRSEGLVLRNGLVGYQLPALQSSVIPIARGDLLILATDGIRAEFAEGLDPAESPTKLADRILARHFKGTDDALVLVARYLGVEHE